MITEKNKKISIRHNRVTWFFVFLLAGCFLFGGNVLAVNDYNKEVNGSLSASEWNALVNDFVKTYATSSMVGPIGIGTTNPSSKLDIRDSVSGGVAPIFTIANTASGVSGQSVRLRFAVHSDWIGFENVSPYVEGVYEGSPSAGGLAFGTYKSGIFERVRISGSGNVGIGTTSPSSYLSFLTFSGKTVDLGGGRIGNLGDPIDLQDAATRAFVQDTVGASSFWTTATGGIHYSSGNVGIGTTTPGYKLTVSADILVNGLIIGKSGGNKNNNIAFGANALVLNTTGDWSTAIGGGALGKNTTGTNNTAVGGGALFENTIGQWNMALGTSALAKNTEGGNNTAVGPSAMYTNTIGSSSVAVGVSALFYNTSGNYNIAVGRSALYNNTTGLGNIGIGMSAIGGNAIGSNNIAIGYRAARYISGSTSYTSSNNSIYIGAETKPYADGMTNEIVIGYDAKGIGSNSVVIGSSSILTTILNGSIGIGTTIPTSKLTIFGGDFEMSNNTSIKVSSSTANTTLLFGNYADGLGFSYGTSTAPTNKTVTLAVEGDVKANRFCIGEDCKDTWQQIVYAGGGGNAVFVGLTAATNGNNNGTPGYKEAFRLCEVAFTGSHVCTPDDMLNTIALNSLMPTEDAWVFSGPPGFTALANDCDGRTSTSNSGPLGAYWEVSNPSYPNGGHGLTSPCGANLKIACCK